MTTVYCCKLHRSASAALHQCLYLSKFGWTITACKYNILKISFKSPAQEDDDTILSGKNSENTSNHREEARPCDTQAKHRKPWSCLFEVAIGKMHIIHQWELLLHHLLHTASILDFTATCWHSCVVWKSQSIAKSRSCHQNVHNIFACCLCYGKQNMSVSKRQQQAQSEEELKTPWSTICQDTRQCHPLQSMNVKDKSSQNTPKEPCNKELLTLLPWESWQAKNLDSQGSSSSCHLSCSDSELFDEVWIVSFSVVSMFARSVAANWVCNSSMSELAEVVGRGGCFFFVEKDHGTL